MTFSFRSWVVLMSAVLLIQGCATAPVNRTTEELIVDGEKLFSDGKYERAVEQWKKVRERYPSPDISAKVELGIADAYFLNKDYIESSVEYEGFRKLHPRHQRAGYALFRQAMSNYKQIKGIDTDQVPVINALTLFESYLVQYPKGEHKAEVLEMVGDCKDKQLQYELYVGRFYLKTGKSVSAVGRFEHALKMFPEKLRRDEILFYLGKAYIETDQKTKSRETFESLVKEFPESVYAKDARTMLEKGL
jgi:outer membrane protein assembly factor BamD